MMFSCSMAEFACESIGFAVNRVSLLRRGAIIYPDGGVVIADKGNPEIYTYYPDGTHRKGYPFSSGN
jgi:hypothetical protein